MIDIDRNNPIIDTRKTIVDGKQPPTAAPAGNGSSTFSQQLPINPQGNGSSSSSTTVKTTSTVPVSTTIPPQYTASSYEELIPQLEKRMAEYRPLSEDELKKLRRRQKAEGIINGISDAVQAVSNLIFTTQYAPSMYNAKEGMSAKAKERFDKEKAEREADADKYLQYALTIGKMKDADKERGIQTWNTEQTLARQDRAYDAARQDRAEDVAFRNKDYDRQGEWHKEEGERWERQFTESVRQFNVNSAMERQRVNIAAQQAAQAMKQGQMTFNLGSGNGNVTLSMDKLNAQTVSLIYSTLPANVRAQVQGEPIVQNGFVVGYHPPTTEAMLIAIGANVESSPDTQSAIKQLAGLETGKKPAGY